MRLMASTVLHFFVHLCFPRYPLFIVHCSSLFSRCFPSCYIFSVIIFFSCIFNSCCLFLQDIYFFYVSFTFSLLFFSLVWCFFMFLFFIFITYFFHYLFSPFRIHYLYASYAHFISFLINFSPSISFLIFFPVAHFPFHLFLFHVSVLWSLVIFFFVNRSASYKTFQCHCIDQSLVWYTETTVKRNHY